MSDRCTTTLLMMAYLTGQLVAVPHAHRASSDNQRSDHDARPHIHVTWFEPSDHFHSDHSADDGHSHHSEEDGGLSQFVSSAANKGHDDHDSNAVYLPNDPEAALPNKSIGSLDRLQVASMLALTGVPAPKAIPECLAEVNFPDHGSPSCPLYLALRALRI